jgi:hypothetical protein
LFWTDVDGQEERRVVDVGGQQTFLAGDFLAAALGGICDEKGRAVST